MAKPEKSSKPGLGTCVAVTVEIGAASAASAVAEAAAVEEVCGRSGAGGGRHTCVTIDR